MLEFQTRAGIKVVCNPDSVDCITENVGDKTGWLYVGIQVFEIDFKKVSEIVNNWKAAIIYNQ